MDANEFKRLLLEKTSAEMVEEVILSDLTGPYVVQEALSKFASKLRAKFNITEEQKIAINVVGSAKLGFSFLSKPGKNGTPFKPAYREYQPGVSDIDVAIVSPVLYGKIWQGIAHFAANQDAFPMRDDLGAYMLSGWLRPDKFPKKEIPLMCRHWQSVYEEISQSEYFRYKKLRCAIYHSKYFLSIYQERGIISAQTAERVA